jgi:hypothetical protein
MMPPHPVLAQLVWDVVMAPPPEDEVGLLALRIGMERLGDELLAYLGAIGVVPCR